VGHQRIFFCLQPRSAGADLVGTNFDRMFDVSNNLLSTTQSKRMTRARSLGSRASLTGCTPATQCAFGRTEPPWTYRDRRDFRLTGAWSHASALNRHLHTHAELKVEGAEPFHIYMPTKSKFSSIVAICSNRSECHGPLCTYDELTP
jgi:hypothetical protein